MNLFFFLYFFQKWAETFNKLPFFTFGQKQWLYLMMSQKKYWICSFFCFSFRNKLRHSTNCHFSPLVRSSGFTGWWARKNIEFALFSVSLSEMSWDIQQTAIHQKQWTSPKTNRTNSKMQWLYLIELLNNWIIDNRFFFKKNH